MVTGLGDVIKLLRRREVQIPTKQK